MRTAEPCVAAFSPGARQTKLCAVMQGDTPAEMRGKTIDRAFVTSLITGFVFVLFKWGAVGRGSSLSLICSSVCEINGQTSHLLGTYGPLTKHVAGEKVLHIRASTFCNSSASVHFACICQPSQEESVDVFEDEARTENPRGVKCTWEAGEEKACNWVPVYAASSGICLLGQVWDLGCCRQLDPRLCQSRWSAANMQLSDPITFSGRARLLPPRTPPVLQKKCSLAFKHASMHSVQVFVSALRV